MATATAGGLSPLAREHGYALRSPACNNGLSPLARGTRREQK
ncbi:hypothetical protein SEET0821_08323 [Salmonella enterica subsp. enterica serovar Tennessee str. TXSC_TXSC08-21]|nr:hypothetical protein SEET0821_08323 [Salmonella enterica subsp. enterica serovar Tennessee str. TXSC_TXSC08-21]